MSDWLNRVTIALPRNASTTHIFNPSNATGGGTVINGTAFTFTAGRFGVIVVYGAVTTTTPTNWTLPTGGSAVGNGGIYMFYRASLAGSDVSTLTHNGTNYPVTATFYEFASGTAFVKSAAGAAIGATAASTALTALAATPHWLGTAKGAGISSGKAYTACAWTGSPTPSELVDHGVAFATTDGYGFSMAEANASSVTSWTPTGTMTGTSLPTCEVVTFALTVAASDQTVSPPVATVTVAGAVPTVTGGGLLPPAATATAAALVPAVTAASTVSPPVATVTAVGKVPVVTSAVLVSPPVATVAATALVPLLGGGIGAPLSTVAVTALVPVVSGPANLAPPTATVAAQALAPTATGAVTVAATLATVAVAAPVPTVPVDQVVLPPAAVVTIAAPVPTVSGGAGDQTVSAPTATVTVAALTPGVTGAVTISPPLATVIVAALAPVIYDPDTLSPPAATVAVIGVAPVVTGAATVASSLATVVVAASSPTATGAALVSPPVGLVSAQAFAPLVTGGGGAGVVAPPPALVDVQCFAPGVAAAASVTAALAMVGAIAYVTLVQGAAALVTPVGITLAQARVPTITAGAVVSPPPAGIASGNWEAYPPRVIGTSNSDPANFYRTRWPQWLPTMLELKIAISGSGVAWLYPNTFLEGCTKSDLVYICRTHNIFVAGLPGV